MIEIGGNGTKFDSDRYKKVRTEIQIQILYILTSVWVLRMPNPGKNTPLYENKLFESRSSQWRLLKCGQNIQH